MRTEAHLLFFISFHSMMTKIVFDIHTRQPVYAVCLTDETQRCVMLTTSIFKAIKKVTENK